MSEASHGATNHSNDMDIPPKAPVIPKFSSFKAPSKPQPQTVPEAETRKDKHEKRDRRNDEERQSRYHRSSDKHRHKRRRTISPPSPPPPPRPPPAATETDVYKIDIKGDSGNIIYGTAYRYSVPTFHRFGAGYVLGLSSKWRIDREKGEGKGIVVAIRGYDTDKRRRGGVNPFAVDSSRVGRLKHQEGIVKGFGPNDEFVPLSGRREADLEADMTVKQDYRSIEGKAKAVGDTDLVSSSEDEDEETFSYSEELRKRTVELDRRLQFHPHEIQSWLDYVSLQDDLAAGQKASTAEIKMGILQKALRKNPGNTKLLVELIKIEIILWEPKKVLAHWEEVLKEHDTMDIWIEYLNYRQTAFVSFTYPEIVAVYSRCLSALRKLAYRAKAPEHKVEIEQTILYVFLRFVHLAREAGYDELAIASIQATMELNLFRPNTAIPVSESQRESELSQFEEFWDSEIPRFGEENAKGWKNFDPDQEPLEPTAGETDEGVGADAIDEWVMREIQSKGRMPARTTDELDDDDPYRVVLFNDISHLLYTFSTEVVQQLPYAVLQFSGIHVPPPEISSLDDRLTDAWLLSAFNGQGLWPSPSNDNVIEWINGEAVEAERLPGVDNPFTFKRKIYPVTFNTLFSSPGQWFQQLEPSDFTNVNTQFLLNALNLLKSVNEDEWLMLYHLAIENTISPSTVLKLAKSYLKLRKTSVRLWNTYALILWGRESFEEARKVWKTAIEMTFSMKSNPIVLWQTWISVEFEVDQDAARRLFSQISSERPDFGRAADNIGGAGKLRTRKYIQDQFYRALSFKDLESLEGYAFLGILLEYLSSNLESGLQKSSEYISAIQERGLTGTITHERVLLSISRLLYIHTKSQGWYRLSTLRDFWQDAINKFPRNTAFLSLYTWNETNSRIDGRVRKLITTLEKSATVDTWIFAVWAEVTIERGRISEFAVRSILENAVESKKGSIVLWMLYIEFELRYGKPLRAKELLLRAMRECPWSKELAMLAFGLLRSLFDSKDLARVYHVLMEKELRVHGELEGMEVERKQIELPHDVSSDEE